MLSKFVFKHNCIHTCSIKTQPNNIDHKVYLGLTHSIMKKFVSFFKFKWLKPFNTQHPTFCAQVYTYKILVQRPQVPLVILQVISFESFISFFSANKYLAITLALTNVDFGLDGHCSHH